MGFARRSRPSSGAGIGAWAMLSLLCALFACQGIDVRSSEPGADVFIDGAYTGYKTPLKLRVDKFTSGQHTISVSKVGFETVTPTYSIDVHVSGGRIVLAVILPLPFLFIGIANDFKTVRAVKPMTFELVPIGAPSHDDALDEGAVTAGS